MEKDFWLTRWQRNEIGFHQADINPYLLQHWPRFDAAPEDTVFVPLCGKSIDMVWLRQQGMQVVGIELSDIAVRDFFVEQSYPARPCDCGELSGLEHDAIRVLCGDFFALKAQDMQSVKYVYDRAALIALPPPMRARYVQHLLDILPAGCQILLVIVDYPQPEMEGPPFSVSVEEVETLFGERARVQLLAQHDVLADNPRFQARGLTRMQESVLLITT